MPIMNTSSSPQDPDASRLHALVDGRLPPEQAALLRASLDAATGEDADAWARQRALLRTLHGDWLQRPLPEALHQAAERLQNQHAQRRRWATWSGVAAGWVLAFGLGWALHGASGGGATQAMAAPRLFAQQATVAHAVYQPEQRHPVEVAAQQQAHLVQWLSKRLGVALKPPVLEAQGFHLMGGRLLPGETGQARAQFMYEDQAGQRVTLYVSVLKPGTAATSAPASFQWSSDGASHGFYWIDGRQGYALSASLPRERLQTLANAIYQQLS